MNLWIHVQPCTEIMKIWIHVQLNNDKKTKTINYKQTTIKQTSTWLLYSDMCKYIGPETNGFCPCASEYMAARSSLQAFMSVDKLN